MRRGQFFNPLKYRTRGGHYAMQGEMLVQRDQIKTGIHPASRQQGLRRRSETQPGIIQRVIQRLDTQPVARKEQ